MACCGRIFTPIIDKARQLDERLKKLAAEKRSARKCSQCGKTSTAEYCSTACKQKAALLKELRS